LKQFLPIHPLTLEDITKPRREPDQGPHFPKVEEFRDYLFVVANSLRPEFLGDPAQPAPKPARRCSQNLQLSAILSRNLLITHHYEPLTSISAVKQFLGRHAEQAARGPDYLFHLVLDAMVDEYAPVVDQVADRLDTIETHLFQRPPARIIAR